MLWPEGTYYVSIDAAAAGFDDDLEMCHALIDQAGVAAIPASYFWHQRRGGRDLVRFCFCKTDETLDEAIRRLERWQESR